MDSAQDIPVGLCQCGCGKRTSVATVTRPKEGTGTVKGQPVRFAKGHGRRRFGHTVDPETGCWNWIGHVTADTGYGTTNLDGQRAYAHRVYYERHVGPIPEGLTIDHLCRNRRCVNPAHLEAVTRGENTLRGESTSGINSRKTHCPRGHALEGENVYHPPTHPHKRQCLTCRRQYQRDRWPSHAKERQMMRELTPNQLSALRVAARNGRWWVHGKGSNRIVEGLVLRGLAEKRWELIANRARHYLIATDAGRERLNAPGVVDLEAARQRREAS